MQILDTKKGYITSKLMNCDTHIIANSISQALVQFLANSGFSEQAVIGGDDRVRMQRLWSKKSSTLKDADSWFEKCMFYIKQDKDFWGYIEEEIITIDKPVFYSPLDEEVWSLRLPKLNPSFCPKGIYKACDIHLSLCKVEPIVNQKLLESGFYYLDLHKYQLGNVRIYTMQTQSPKIGKKIFEMLKNIVAQGGGVEGFIKFEFTRNLYNQGFSLPPMILS